jgi:hypothetical protein
LVIPTGTAALGGRGRSRNCDGVTVFGGLPPPLEHK